VESDVAKPFAGDGAVFPRAGHQRTYNSENNEGFNKLSGANGVKAGMPMARRFIERSLPLAPILAFGETPTAATPITVVVFSQGENIVPGAVWYGVKPLAF
jgi:hypothetical protein